MLTDTHCHLDYSYDLDAVIYNATQNGIHKMINNGCDFDTNKIVLNISLKYKNVFPAIGLHPENINENSEEIFKQIIENIDKIVAIGEIGLDYLNGISDKEKQKSVFKKQLEIALKYDKPVIIHSRNANDDVINILKEFKGLRGVIHCFSGTKIEAICYIQLGFKLGFNGIITFKNYKDYSLIKDIDLSDILLETDSPYLTPVPYRGKKNEPANISFVAKKICEIKEINLEELSTTTELTVHRVFDI